MDIDDIRRALCSDKITIRKKGRTYCQDLFFHDKTVLSCNHVQTMGFIRALFEYETKEIDTGQLKGKNVNVDVASFVKKIVKYCVANGQILSAKAALITEHVLNILYDQTLPALYRTEHRLMLCELLEPRITHSLPFDKVDKQVHIGLNKLFLYLRDTMVDSKSCSDANNLKLLRLLCRSMFCDKSNQPSTILKYLLQWFNDLLTFASDSVVATNPQLLSCLADCCRYFMEYQGANVALTLFSTIDPLLQLVIKQMSTHQFRESHRISFVKFMMKLIEVSSAFDWKRISVLPPINPLHNSIFSLCSIILSDESLRTLLLFATSTILVQHGGSSGGRQHQRDACLNVLDDPKVARNYELIATVCYHQQVQSTVQERAATTRNDRLSVAAAGSSSSSSSSNIFSTQFNGNHEFGTQASKRQRTQANVENGVLTNSNDSECLPAVDNLIDRLRQVRTIVGGKSPKVAQPPLFGTQYKSQFAFTGSTASAHHQTSALAQQSASQLSDSLVYLCVALFRHYPHLDFLSAQCLSADDILNTASKSNSQSGKSVDAICDKLCEWIGVFADKVRDCLQMTGAVDFHQFGLFLLALIELAQISHKLWVSLDNRFSVHFTNKIRANWTALVAFLLESRPLSRLINMSLCKKGSVVERLLTLFGFVMRYNLLENEFQSTYLRTLYDLAVVRDPRTTDSPEAFNFLSALFKMNRRDVPGKLFSKLLTDIKERLSDDSFEGDLFGKVDGQQEDQALSTLTSLIGGGSNDSRTDVSGVHYVALWLFDAAQPLVLDVAVHNAVHRVSIAQTHAFNLSICELLRDELGNSRSEVPTNLAAAVDIVEVSRALLEQDKLHWLSLSPELLCCDTRDFSQIKSIDTDAFHKVQCIDANLHSETVTHAFEVLSCVKDQLLAMRQFTANSASRSAASRGDRREFNSAMFAIRGDALGTSDGVIGSWQVISVMLLNAFGQLLKQQVDSKSGSASTNGTTTLKESILESFLELLHANLVYIQNKAILTKPAQLADYMSELAFVLQNVAMQFTLASDNSRKLCCDLLSDLIKILQKESSNSRHGSGSLHDLDFDRDEKSSEASSSATQRGMTHSGTGRARRTATETFAIDDEDDFMDTTPASSSSARNHASSRVDGNSSDGDIAAGQGFLRGRQADTRAVNGFSGKARSVYSSDHLRVLIAAIQSIVFLSTPQRDIASVAFTAGRLVDFLSVMEASGGGNNKAATRLVTSSEVYLQLAWHLSVLAPTSLVIMTIRGLIDRSPWHIEWGPLGYCKVLGVIHNITASKTFWLEAGDQATAVMVDEDEVGNDVEYFLRLVLPRDDKVLEPFPKEQFQARILQIECIASLMRHGTSDTLYGVKNEITTLFVDAVADPDVRVRWAASRHIPLLLTKFKNRDKVYTALVTATSIPVKYETSADRTRNVSTQGLGGDANDDSSSENADVDPLLTLTTGLGIARMGCSTTTFNTSDVTLIKRSLLDLLVLCCSRHKRLKPVTFGTNLSISCRQGAGAVAITHRMSQADVRTQELEDRNKRDAEKRLLSGCLNYQDVLFTLLDFVAQTLGYSSTNQLLFEYLRWLLYQWLVVGNFTNMTKSADSGSETRLTDSFDGLSETLPLDMTLADFPYKLFINQEENSRISDQQSFALFLTKYSDIILPLLAAVTNHRLRWKLLTQYTEDAGYGNTDRDLTLVVKLNIASIKGLEFSLFYAGMSRREMAGGDVADDEVYEEAMRTVRALQEFVSRNLNSAETGQIVTTKLSDTLQALFLLQTIARAAECEVPVHEVSTPARESAAFLNDTTEFLSTILRKVCELVNVSRIELLLGKCNTLEWLSTLRNRLLQSRLPSVCRAVLGSVKLLINNTADVNFTTSFFHAVLTTLKLAIDRFPLELHTIFVVLRDLSNALCRTSQVENYKTCVNSCIEYIFCEIMCLLRFLTIKLNQIPKDGGDTQNIVHIADGGGLRRTRAARGSADIEDDDYDEQASVEDTSDRSNNEDTFLSVYYSSLNATAFNSNQLFDAIQYLNETLSLLYQFIKENERDHVLANCLNMSSNFLSCVTDQNVRGDMVSGKWRLRPVGDRILSFSNRISRLVNGECFVRSIIFVELLILRDSLQKNDDNLPIGDDSRNVVSSKGWWNVEPELTATFVSALLCLCQSETNRLKERTDDTNALRDLSVGLLGYLGPPSIYSLSHSADFPTQLGDLVKVSRYSAIKMRYLLVQRVYSILYDASSSHQDIASQCLRQLNFEGYFAELKTSLNLEAQDGLSGGATLMDIVTMYSIPIQPKHTCRLLVLVPGDLTEESAFSDALWSTVGHGDYDQWVTQVTHVLIARLYDDKKETKKEPNSLITKGNDVFIRSCKGVCLLRSDVAENIFLLLVSDLLAVNGAQSYICDKLSQCVRQHMLSTSCSLPRVTQLGCQLLIFLMRQDISLFVEKSQQKTGLSAGSAVLSKTDSGGKVARRVEPSKTNDGGDWKLPFSYYLNIDYQYAAAAASRCQAVCSALQFVELAIECDKHVLGTAPSNCGVIRSTAGEWLNKLLVPIYRGLHDPDALHAVTNQSSHVVSSLTLQAVMYEHEGRWLEALSTYESIAQTRIETSNEVEQGILRSLDGLGARHTFNRFQSSNEVDTEIDSSHNLFQWSNSVSGSATAGSSTLGRNRDGWDSSVDAVTKLVACRDSVSALQQVTSLSANLFTNLAVTTAQESAHHTVIDMIRTQQLTEITEVCSVLDRHQDVEKLLKQWKSRTSVDGKGLSGLRFELLSQLLRCDMMSASQAVNCMSEVIDKAKSKDVAHSLSPLVYRFWNDVNTHVSGLKINSIGSSKTDPHQKVLHAQWALYECKLLWYKGLKEIAVADINSKVIQVLKQLVGSSSTDIVGNSTASVSSSGVKLYGGRNNINLQREPLHNSPHARNLLSEALRVGGEWMGTKRAATGTEILEEYLNPAASMAVGVAERIAAHETLGRFNARLHHNVRERVTSVEWKQGARVLSDRQVEYNQCKNLCAIERSREQKDMTNPDVKALFRHTGMLKKEIDLDLKERTAVEASVNKYLLAAMTEYGKVLALSREETLDAVFSVVKLWLNNCQNAHVNNVMDEMLESVPSYKFVPLTYQILSRLGGDADRNPASTAADDDLEPLSAVLRRNTTNSARAKNGTQRALSVSPNFTLPKTNDELFQFVLFRLVYKLCSDHPHHSLAQLFALSNEREMSGTYDGVNLSNNRNEAANKIITMLHGDARVSALVVSTQTLLLAYIELAKASTSEMQKTNRTKDIRFKEIQSRGKRFNETATTLPGNVSDRPPVITLPVRVNVLQDYRDVPRTMEFQPTFSITENGISRPKIISCLGNDGVWYKQLVKGGDDMRQDAVMEQVFDTVNHMLDRDEETSKRALSIRTYKIVPTTPQTGVLQWVEHTMPFGAILYDKEIGTHNRYYNSNVRDDLNTKNAINNVEWTHLQCREYLKDAADYADKLKKFNEVVNHFHPSFRFFFMEHYADPVQWMSCRLAYTRSVAVTSMVGYILGIGDRHAHNILVDSRTAEVVHIDFGIVFEQGKGLGAPETVPFRLTRDIVDGMGISGVNGTFRRCSEEVLRVLRDNTPQIMTILEVVIHDPLYKWSLSPLQARVKQNTVPDFQLNFAKGGAIPAQHSMQTGLAGNTTAKTGGSFGKDAAERTLTRVHNKLQGYEDPTGEAMGVEGLVDLLINEARSYANLCRLFPGWAPWL